MWYKQSIRPIDPVIQYDEPQPTIRYIRENFFGAGQFSYPQPPAQPQDQFDTLKNTMPIMQGIIEKRWGYGAFGFPNVSPELMFEYQNEATTPPYKKLVVSGPDGVTALNEDGTLYTYSGIYTPANNVAPHMVNSRSTGYFADGTTNVKWSGAATAGVTNWGISIDSGAGTGTSTTLTGTPTTGTNMLPDNSGSASQWTFNNPLFGSQPTWTSDWNMGVGNPIFHTYNLFMTGAGFSVPGGKYVESATLTLDFTVNPQSDNGADTCALWYGFVLNGQLFGTPIYEEGSTAAASGTRTYTLNNGIAVNMSPDSVNDSSFGIWFSYRNGAGTNPFVDRTVTVTSALMDVTYTDTPPGIQIANGGVGAITLTSGRVYYYVFRNSTTGHMSDLSAPSENTGAITNLEVNLSDIGVSTDPQVDRVWLLATADGGDETLLYFLADIPNGTTTYTDNTDELSLLANNIVQEEDAYGNDIGVADNDPPPAGNYPTKHQGRIFLATNGTLYCSKSLGELTTSTGLICGRWEEAFPPVNQFDISDEAEIIRGMISDGTTLYVATNRHIRRLTGDSPADFQLQQVVFNEAGLVSHEAITVVFNEGTPAGAMWITPDFRVLQSDFNTYADVGTPIQDVLNTINPDSLANIRATFYSTAAFDICVFAFNTTDVSGWNDTWAVFDLRNKQWQIWKLTDVTKAQLFTITQDGTPHWLLADTSNNVRIMGSDFNQDMETDFQMIARTTWWHLGSPTARKYLNEIEFVADPSILVTLEGANTFVDFKSPVVLVNNVNPVQTPLGTFKVFLSHVPAWYRYYRLTITAI